MKIIKPSGGKFLPIFVILMFGWLAGCGNVTSESTSTNGSTTTTVGGSTSVGASRTLDLTTNRDTITVGDQALITVTATNTDGSNFQAGTTSDLKIIFNYAISQQAELGETTDELILKKGTPATATTAAIPGESASAIIDTVVITGAEVGSAIFTAQSLDAIATLVIDVISDNQSALK
ncbi:MAG: hypothetical protein ACE5EK_01620 [Nitrospinales bacterium]